MFRGEVNTDIFVLDFNFMKASQAHKDTKKVFSFFFDFYSFFFDFGFLGSHTTYLEEFVGFLAAAVLRQSPQRLG